MRSKRSKAWHVRKEAAQVRAIIENGSQTPFEQLMDSFISIEEYARRTAEWDREIGTVSNVRFIFSK